MMKRIHIVGLVIVVGVLMLSWWLFANANGQLLSKEELMKKIWAGENAQTQNFYGKIVDQTGQPVEGATATGTLMKIQGFDTGTKKESFTTQSDQNGQFEFTGHQGWQLGVVVKKEGYQMGRGEGVYQAPNKEDKTSATERAIFKMWKLMGAEPMAFARIHAYIPCDGSTTDFNLLTGRSVPTEGDLKVKLIRTPIDIVPGKPFHWAVSLEITNGGLIQQTDAYPNEAPTTGYQPSVTIDMPVEMPNWNSNLKKAFYFEGRNGTLHGRMTIDITANFQPPPTAFFANIYTNPSGSRNLEYDPQKRLNEK